MLLTTDRQREVIAACCEQSSACGVTIGMTLAHARALLQGRPVIEERFDPAGDERALHRLAAWAIRFTPLVAPDAPDGLLMNITGCERLYGGEARLLDRVQHAFAQLGIAARIACASTIGCAWAAARFAAQTPCIVESGAERDAMRPLPIESLRLDGQTVTGLHEVGVQRVEHLLAIPRNQLVARFGSHVLMRIDQALGDQEELLNAIAPRQPIVAERIFNGPVADLEAMFITVRELLQEAATALAADEAGAMELSLTLDRVDASPIHIAIRLSRPSRDVKHLWSLLRPRVENVHMGYGVDSVTLHVRAARRVVHEQHSARNQWQDDAPSKHGELDREAGQLIDTLAHRLGPQRTLKMQMRESHQPQRVARYVSLLSDQPPRRSAVQSLLIAADRPSQLLPEPELIDVIAIAPEGPPVWMRWRQQEHRIISAIGPERIVEEWWAASSGDATGTAGGKDYFKVQIETGRWLWVFRQQQSNRWFVHGAWT